MKIRKAEKEDLKGIAEIFRVEYSKPPYNGKWNKKNSFEAISEHFKKYKIYVIEIDKKIVGFTVIEEITSLERRLVLLMRLLLVQSFSERD